MSKTAEKFLDRLGHALLWRIHRLLGNNIRHRLRIRFAKWWRPLLNKPAFICITGSAGKTTTKELLHNILSDKRRGVANPETLNGILEIPKNILRMLPHYDYCISELGAPRPSSMDAPLSLLRPTIGIVTLIANDHWSAYKSREAIAEEKGKLIASLPKAGTAVLNADDDLVMGMAQNCTARIITFGVSKNAQLRAEILNATWPDRLCLNLYWDGECAHVRTQLCGTHSLTPILAAIGGGLAVGLSLHECAKGVERFAPYEGRMQPVMMPDGVTFIRDDFKAPLWSIDSSLEFIKSARAKRKILVIGTISDCGTSTPQKYARVAERAQLAADITVFVGPWASSVLKKRKAGNEDALQVFSKVREASKYINGILQEGDLVFLKGTNPQDHLFRIIMARTERIACWRDDCKLMMFCNACQERNIPSGLHTYMASDDSLVNEIQDGQLEEDRSISSDEQLIVALGNPEVELVGTPHNIGYEVADRIAASLKLIWNECPEGWITHGSVADRKFCLIKFRENMNLIGGKLREFSRNKRVSPSQCILLHDDLALPIGSIRTRLNGGAGGHKGVSSILEAFQTDQIRRVKIGVQKANTKLSRAEYVLTKFAIEDRSAIDAAISSAQAATLQLVAQYREINEELKSISPSNR